MRLAVVASLPADEPYAASTQSGQLEDRRTLLRVGLARTRRAAAGHSRGPRDCRDRSVRGRLRRRVHVLQPIEVARAVLEPAVAVGVRLADCRRAEPGDERRREPRPRAVLRRGPVEVEAQVGKLRRRPPFQDHGPVGGNRRERLQRHRGRAVELVRAYVPGSGTNLGVDVEGGHQGAQVRPRVERSIRVGGGDQVQVLGGGRDVVEADADAAPANGGARRGGDVVEPAVRAPGQVARQVVAALRGGCSGCCSRRRHRRCRARRCCAA